jgi:hypothetical protein
MKKAGPAETTSTAPLLVFPLLHEMVKVPEIMTLPQLPVPRPEAATVPDWVDPSLLESLGY